MNFLVELVLRVCPPKQTMSVESKKLLKASMAKVMVGDDEKGQQNGKDFYKFFFTNFGDLRKYFKGAENFTAEDVQKSERFEKQGQRLLLAVHILCDTIDNIEVFKGYVREMVVRHRQFKLDPSLWLAFFTVWVAFLESKQSLTDETKRAWEQLGKTFNDEAQKQLKSMGLPHV